MRSSNPVLSRPEAFQRGSVDYGQPGQPYQMPGQPYAGQGYQQSAYAPQGYQQPGYNQPPTGYQPTMPGAGVMTIEDVIAKTALTLGSLFLVAAATFFLMPVPLLAPAMIIAALVGFVTVLVVAFRRTINPAAVLAYAVVEGIFIGAVSRFFELMYPGIVVQAILGTFVAAGVTLAAYKHFRIRVTDKFRRIVVMSTIGLAAMFLVNLVLSLFGLNTGLVGIGPTAGILSWLISAVAVVLAVANLILDFDYVERGIANRAPESESWRAAFGLTVTMVWLYVEILRILSYFRSN